MTRDVPAAPVAVINSTVYQDNPYHGLIYAALAGRYECIRGTLDDAFQLVSEEDSTLLHLHWEEHLLRGIPSAAEARLVVRHFTTRLAEFRRCGGRVAWTVHNSAPHEDAQPETFLSLRRAIAVEADRILVHTTEALAMLEAQVGTVGHKTTLLPHPSYLGVYEPEARSQAGPVRRRQPALLALGKIRTYKRLDRLVETLTETFLTALDAELHISGDPMPGDPAAATLATACADRHTVRLNIRRVPDAELGDLVRGARAVVLDYERHLSSGVALLALTFGVPIVAPRLPGLLELMPSLAHPLLFTPGSAADLRRAAALALTMPAAAQAEVAQACKARARHLHPLRISRMLGDAYDDLRGAGRAAAPS
ncbi:glycosyltransferase [Falsiroseomonas sp. E2-1-a20]|uniref:glycosyltransferase n=1 Tax=Falsiroseomonas sp. E2-1-a20 TaxID=3239300 RepID=UPI003F3B3EF1